MEPESQQTASFEGPLDCYFTRHWSATTHCLGVPELRLLIWDWLDQNQFLKLRLVCRDFQETSFSGKRGRALNDYLKTCRRVHGRIHGGVFPRSRPMIIEGGGPIWNDKAPQSYLEISWEFREGFPLYSATILTASGWRRHAGIERPDLPRLFAKGKLCLAFEQTLHVVRQVPTWRLLATKDLGTLDHLTDELVPFGANEELILHTSTYSGKIHVLDSSLRVFRRLVDGSMTHGRSSLASAVSQPDGNSVLARYNDGTCYVWSDIRGESIQGHDCLMKKTFHSHPPAGVFNAGLDSHRRSDLAWNRHPIASFSTGEDVIAPMHYPERAFGPFAIYKNQVQIGSFAHEGACDCLVFLGMYIVTVTREREVRIWSKQGQLLACKQLRSEYPCHRATWKDRMSMRYGTVCISQGARLVCFSYHYQEAICWDFQDPVF